MNTAVCRRCGKQLHLMEIRRACPCYACRQDIAHELRQLGISVLTANAMAKSGRLSEWTDFAKYDADSWRGVPLVGACGRRQIAAALEAYAQLPAPSAEMEDSPQPLVPDTQAAESLLTKIDEILVSLSAARRGVEQLLTQEGAR